MILVLALVLQIVGVVFILAAAVGLIRFADPLQRMHASTKAGTVGAGFVVLGVIVEMGDAFVAAIGLATLLFLILTIPVAGHLLGRAAYLSGARLEGLEDRDALKGVVARSELTLDEKLAQSALEEDRGPL